MERERSQLVQFREVSLEEIAFGYAYVMDREAWRAAIHGVTKTWT